MLSFGNGWRMEDDMISAGARGSFATKCRPMQPRAAFLEPETYKTVPVNKQALWTKNLMKIA